MIARPFEWHYFEPSDTELNFDLSGLNAFPKDSSSFRARIRIQYKHGISCAYCRLKHQ